MKLIKLALLDGLSILHTKRSEKKNLLALNLYIYWLVDRVLKTMTGKYIIALA
jgi:hypothetical protein